MSADASKTFEWADGEYKFRLAIGQLRELQDKTGVGPYALLSRVIDRTWKVDDLREVIRLGLIGGGLEPLKALSLVKNYVEGRPLMESLTPVKVILAAALFGDPDDPVGKRNRRRPRINPVQLLRSLWNRCRPRLQPRCR
jgi:hypothetical protein